MRSRATLQSSINAAPARICGNAGRGTSAFAWTRTRLDTVIKEISSSSKATEFPRHAGHENPRSDSDPVGKDAEPRDGGAFGHCFMSPDVTRGGSANNPLCE